ncbi:XopAD/skwp family type III secretion system effector, partial [Ralstonia pseudosolanacearum]
MSTEIKGVRKMRPRSAAEPDVSTPFRHDTQAGRVAPACSAHGAQRAHAPTGEQLVECERALLHCAELQQQRAQHVSRLTKLAEDSRLRKQVSVHECVDLACANVLAKRNGYGLALVFLAAGATPEENVRQLTNYFFALQAALLRASQPERRQLGQCADLAAHYLFKTPWFARAPLRPFVMLGNLLSKYPDHPACLQALSWIADQVLAPAQMPALGEKDLALLANALSKNSGCGRSEQAVARIGRHVVRAGAGDFRAQSVSLMLNACSKWSGNADCRDAVEVLAARVSEDAALQRDMAAQAVANALNALSKWPERIGCRNAVLALAVRVAADVALRCRMKPQEVANALNALSKW